MLWAFIIGFVLIHWLWRINKKYYVLAFFSHRVRTVDGTPVEQKIPIAKGRTIFANSFDLLGLDNAGVFNHSRKRARQFGRSYLEHGGGKIFYNIIDADDAEMVLNDQNLITKGTLYDFLHPVLHTGLLTSTGSKWHSRRKILTPTFHFNILGQFLEVFKTESIKFVQKFADQTESVVSLSTVIPRFTLNSICETAMGVKLDDMAEKGDRYRRSFNYIEESFIRRVSNPLYWNEKIYNYFAADKYKPHVDIVHEFSSEIIAKRRELFAQHLDSQKQTQNPDEDIYITRKQRFAMLDTLICAEKDGLIDHAGICEEVDTLMFEGFDTTSMGLIFGLMNLSLYPEQQELCYQEIQEHIDDDLTNLDINQLNKLKYLECFIKETIRLYPSVPVIGRRNIAETQLSNGLILPPNTQISIHIFDIHRNPKYYRNPDDFDPKRFDTEISNKRHTYAFLPFSAGQRNCIGQKYAMLEMKTLIVAVLKNYKILPVVDPKEFCFESGIVIRAKNDIKAKFVKRK